MGHFTDLNIIYELICLAVVILLIACVNYILLTLTSTVSRSQDVGIRKTIGAGRKQIIWQYYVETQLLAFISVVFGLFLAIACFPFFGSLTGTELQLSYFSFGDVTAGLLSLCFILGLVAGIYPAMVMSGLRPLNIIRGFSAYKLNPAFSKGLIVVQFTICVVVIISSLVMDRQMRFISQTDMGFDKDNLVLIETPYNFLDRQKTAGLKDRLHHFAETEPSIADMTSSAYAFGGGFDSNAFDIGDQKVMLQALSVDFNYFEFNKIPIVKGRTFSRDIAGDTAKILLPDWSKFHKYSSARHSIVVNQTLYSMLGKPRLGELNNTLGGIIIGVCKDYHTEDMTKKIGPAYHKIDPRVNNYFEFRIKAHQNIPLVMDKIKNNWTHFTNNAPFVYSFMDDRVAKSYESYLRWMITITVSCIIAIIIACLGLFGLSGITTINRTKEIGIRKILGASLSSLFILVNRGTLVQACLSFIIAVPIALYLVHQWLQNFAYQITPDWSIVLVAAIISLFTAIVAVSYHTIKVALANPARSLRND